MDVEIAIRFSEDRACRVTIARPDTGEIIYMIVTPAVSIPQSVAEGCARRAGFLRSSHGPVRGASDSPFPLPRLYS
jgi:hypothetical protein